ncbi:MAG: hypothetical protein HZA22_13635 [Nitrospirae bacterium]|nr:hypothetical protein [Nitrospirota bacterium]
MLLVLVTPVFLVACEEEKAATTVDPKVLAATVEEAMKSATVLGKKNMEAYGKATLGAAMASSDPGAAMGVLDQAVAIVRDTHSASNKAMVADLKAKTEGWSASEKEQLAPAIKDLEEATTRVWVMRAAAEGIARMDRGKAMGVLAEAAAEAEANANARYRDLDLRSVAAAMGGIDTASAVAVAGKIADARVKTMALTSIGSAIAGSNPAEADRVLSAAAEVAKSIQRMEPASALISDETKAETRDKVLAGAKSRLVAASAEGVAAAAKALYAVNPGKASSMFADAVSIADGIEHPYTKAYALSNVGIDISAGDPAGGMAVAEKIDAAHADAKFACMMAAIRTHAAKTGSPDVTKLKEAQHVAEGIENPYEKARALEMVGLALVPASKDVAIEVANSIEAPELRDEVMAAIAVEWSKQSDDEAKAALDKIAEPRFANLAVKYTKGSALLDMAEIKLATDAEAAAKLYGKAAGVGADCKSGVLQWKAAVGLCKLDSDKLFDMAAKIEADNYTKAMALAEIAEDWSMKGDFKAPMVWDMAAKAAAGMDDDLAAGEALAKIGSMCAKHDKARAAAIFARSLEKMNKVGTMPEEG